MTACGHNKNCSIVAAVAGRRIDAQLNERKSFPLERVPLVRAALLNLFKEERFDTLVSSAACGADLLALDVALSLGIRCHVILPFSAPRFRESSVADRPGDWGPLFDAVYSQVSANGTITILAGEGADDTAYSAATRKIINDALKLASPLLPTAVLVWEGMPHNGPDATAEFQKLAKVAGMSERAISTC